LIFDEIDAGIGGEAAWVVGKKLSGLASKHQVICVTHLPQIAGFADVHFHVDKAVKSNRTVTSIEKLNKDGRIDEIARMLGGEKITTITQKHAREIVERNSCKL
jgi:DNA repair protein RecN (Recombination protein N)